MCGPLVDIWAAASGPQIVDQRKRPMAGGSVFELAAHLATPGPHLDVQTNGLSFNRGQRLGSIWATNSSWAQDMHTTRSRFLRPTPNGIRRGERP